MWACLSLSLSLIPSSELPGQVWSKRELAAMLADWTLWKWVRQGDPNLIMSSSGQENIHWVCHTGPLKNQNLERTFSFSSLNSQKKQEVQEVSKQWSDMAGDVGNGKARLGRGSDQKATSCFSQSPRFQNLELRLLTPYLSCSIQPACPLDSTAPGVFILVSCLAFSPPSFISDLLYLVLRLLQ